ELHVVDVGQGDGLLLRSPEGRVMVVDGGPRRGGFADYLAKVGVQRVDVLIATNPDADHIGGLIEVLRRFPVGEVYVSGDINTTRTYEEFLDALDASRAPVRVPTRGDRIPFGSVTVEVLNPSEPRFPDRNNNSVVVKVTYGEVSFLLMGDAERAAEERLVSTGADLRADVLKMGHHASRTSTWPFFVERVRPRIAVYSAGRDNPYGHPHKEPLQNLLSRGVTVYGTDKYGTIILSTNGKTLQVQTERQP
ncbi:MAG: ComEC/Rec2 family competence protein, partial [Chloroflexota bacterium]|nr:ComEC/Rec2 family competence protein [Chloroflexota bacterium]